MILSVDPGTVGAYALLGRNAQVADLPVHHAQHGRNAKVRAELDLHCFHDQLAHQEIQHVFIERVGPMPRQGLVSTFRFGESTGALYGIIVGLGFPITFVRPQDWQKFHHIGPSPDAARQRAVQLYPNLAPMLARKCDHHRADALLIGAYGLNQLVNGGHEHG